MKNADGIDPNSTPSRNASSPGSTRRPTVARYGFGATPITASSSPTPITRSMHTGVVARNTTSTPYSSASVAAMTSFWTSP